MKQKILFIQHLSIFGGATKSLLGLVLYFKNLGYDVEVVFYGEKGDAFHWFEQQGISCMAFPEGRVFQHAYGAYIPIIQKKPYRVLLAFYRALKSIGPTRRKIRELAPDLVYLNTSLLFPAAIAAKQLNIKTVWHLREQLHAGLFGLRKLFIKLCFRACADRVICISKTNARVLGLKDSKVVYNSTSTSIEILPEELVRFNTDYAIPDLKIISFLGGKVRSKGGDILVQAVEILLKSRKDFVLVIAGSLNIESQPGLNPIEKNILSRIKRNPELRNHIRFTQSITNVRPLLSQTDILVWPATTPHFSRPVMEAMMMGKTVLASDFQSTREIVEHNVDGYLVKPEPNEIAHALDTLLQDSALRDRLGTEARKKALTLFDEVENQRMNADIVEQLLTADRETKL